MADTPTPVAPAAKAAKFSVKAELLKNGIYNARKGRRQAVNDMTIMVAGPVNGERCLGLVPLKTKRRSEFTGELEEVEIPCFTEDEIKATLEYDSSLAKWFDYPADFKPGKKA